MTSLNDALLLVLSLICGGAILYGNRQRKRAETAEDRLIDEVINAALKQTQTKVQSTDLVDLVNESNKLYPSGSGNSGKK